ncbi:PucR family transcriptional regulator ligand-binding domain-containing protein [Bacillaceae bacterium]
MQGEFTLTVGDVLKRPLFAKARLVAGKNGLGRKIRWVHILEVADFDALIHGEEMILSTGVGLHGGSATKRAFLEKLIKHGASCLCLELGQYFDNVSAEMVEIANRHAFPILVFHETVRFVDITQDLHSLIINRHQQMLEKLDKISREFHRLTLTSQGTAHILRLLHQSTKAQVVYLPGDGDPKCIPSLPVPQKGALCDFLHRQLGRSFTQHQWNQTPFSWEYGGATILLQPVEAMGRTWAHLTLVIANREPEEFDFLLLDRASLSLAQEILRTRFSEERKLHLENLWVNDLIHDRIKNEEHIRALIGPPVKDRSDLFYRVCLIEIAPAAEDVTLPEKELESVRLHIALMIRTLFENFAFHPLMTTKNGQLIVVALDLHPDKSEKDRLHKVFAAIESIDREKLAGDFSLRVAAGRRYMKLTHAPVSYLEAQKVLRTRRITQKEFGPFYEDLGAFRLLLSMEDEKAARAFVDDYLGPLIAHDRAKGSDLVRTLKIFLDNQGAKRVTAEKLFITRQALYHRLQKIRELLGENFMSPENRLAFEMAIRAHQLLNPGEWPTAGRSPADQASEEKSKPNGNNVK